MTGLGERVRRDTSQEESQTHSSTVVMGTGVAGEVMLRVGPNACFQLSFLKFNMTIMPLSMF